MTGEATTSGAERETRYVVGQYSNVTHHWVDGKEYDDEPSAESYYSAQTAGLFEMWEEDIATGRVVRMIHRSEVVQRDIAAERRATRRREQLAENEKGEATT